MGFILSSVPYERASHTLSLRRALHILEELRIFFREFAELFFYANSEPQPNAKYSCAASVAIAR